MALRDIVERHYRNFNEGNPEGDREILSADVVTEVPGGGTMHGNEAHMQFVSAWHAGFPDGSLQALNVVESGDIVISEGVLKGTHTGPLVGPAGTIPATGKRVEFKFVDVFKVRDGKVVEHRVYFDQVAFMTQLGLMPAPQTA